MKSPIRVATLILPAILTVAAGPTLAADLCSVPEADRQPIEQLQSKLEGEGLTIKNIKVDSGCYEVYATNTSGDRIENYYDPKTFELVKAK